MPNDIKDIIRKPLSYLSKGTMITIIIILGYSMAKIWVNDYKKYQKEMRELIIEENKNRCEADSSMMKEIKTIGKDVTHIHKRQDQVILKIDIIQKQQPKGLKSRLDLIDSIYNMQKSTNYNNGSYYNNSNFIQPLTYEISQPEYPEPLVLPKENYTNIEINKSSIFDKINIIKFLVNKIDSLIN